ncbi:MAG: hypothetical protein OEV94_02620 [Deltaproteobacteria bacterium]|nr:hypothetical protein [Deltaproteobacteria bacterium]
MNVSPIFRPCSRLAATVIMLGVAGFVLLPSAAHAQYNFTPLEKGDIQEQEDRVLVVQGLKAGGDYAFWAQISGDKELTAAQRALNFNQHFRLKLDSAPLRQADMHLTLEVLPSGLNSVSLRSIPTAPSAPTNDGLNLALTAREAYFRWRFNPLSGLVMGKQALTLGDAHGKVFQGLTTGLSCECKMGTWDFPVSVARTGSDNGNWMTNIGFGYTAWEEGEAPGSRDRLKVSIFRLVYDESNVPLGKNLGPSVYTAATPGTANSTQMADGGTPNAVFYDVNGMEYFGLRVEWESGWFFLDTDVTSGQGKRKYHRYRDPVTGLPTAALSTGNTYEIASVSGGVLQVETGIQGGVQKFSLQFLQANGDPYVDPATAGVYTRTLQGYYPITNNTFAGPRYYFNGFSSQVGDGTGLGNSISNTQVTGLVYTYDDPKDSKKKFLVGLYGLSLVQPTMDATLKPQKNLGVELDGIMTFYFAEELQFEMELDMFSKGPAFRYPDTWALATQTGGLYRLQARFLYHF